MKNFKLEYTIIDEFNMPIDRIKNVANEVGIEMFNYDVAYDLAMAYIEETSADIKKPRLIKKEIITKDGKIFKSYTFKQIFNFFDKNEEKTYTNILKERNKIVKLSASPSLSDENH